MNIRVKKWIQLLPFFFFCTELNAQLRCDNWLRVKDPLDAVTIGDVDISGTKLTVEAFFNRVVPYTPANDHRYSGDIVSKHLNPSDCNYLLRPTHCEITTTNGFYTTPSACDISFNKIYHVAMVYDGSILRFYRNGFLISEINATGNLITNDWLTTIGDIAGFPKPALAENLNGYINEVRIWQVAKSQTELRNGLKGPLANPASQVGLIAYYRFNSLQNLQGNNLWNGKLVANAQINSTNTACDFIADSCEIFPKCAADFWYKQDICDPLKIQFFSSDSSQNITWNFGDGSASTSSKSPVHTFPRSADYKIQLVLDGTCFALAEKTISMGIQFDDVIKNKDTIICENGIVKLQSDAALSYCWTPSTYLDNPSISNPTAKPLSDITYKVSSKVAGGNLIVNGDFSGDNTGFTSSYRYFSSGLDPGIYYVAKSPNPWHPSMPFCTDHTTGNGNMMLVNGADVPGVKVWTQTINITPSTHFEFSCWVQNISSSTLNPCQLQFYINGLPLGPIFSSLTNSCQWTKFFTEWNSGTATKAEISLVNQNTGFTGNDFALDDISFTPIVFKEDSVKIHIEKPIVKASNDSTICLGSAAQLNATGAQTYSWFPVNGLNFSNIANPIATPLTNISYIVTGKTANGCTAKDTVNISVFQGVKAVDFSFERNLCSSSELQFFNSGSVPVYWDFGDGTPIVQKLSPVHQFPSGNKFNVKMWSAPGQCQNTDTIIKIIDLDINYKKLITTNDTIVCENTSFQLRSVSASEYCWSPSIYLNNANIRDPVTTPLKSVTYLLTTKTVGNNLIVNGNFNAGNNGFVSDYNFASPNITEGEYFVGPNPQAWNAALSKCVDHTSGLGNMMLVNGSPVADVKVWSQAITVNPNTDYEFSTWIQALWPPNPAKLQFSINGIVLGNVITAGLPTCNWTKFNTNWNSGNSTSAIISIVNKNTEVQGNDFALDDIFFAPYTFNYDSVKIIVEKPAIAAMNDTAVCPGASIFLYAQGANSYSWFPITGLSNPALQSPLATVNNKTTFTVAGTTINGCTANDSVTISMLSGPQITITKDTLICNIEPVQLSASGGIMYTWSPAASLSNSLIANPVASPIVSTKYSVIVKGANGCSTVDSVNIAVISRPVIVLVNDTSICRGGTARLNANGGVSYKWTPITGLSNPNISNPLASPTADTKYFVSVTNSGGCTSLDSMVVSLLPDPVVSVSSDTSICKGGTASLMASGAVSFSWSPVAGLNNSLVNNPTANPVSNTTYKVSGTDLNGCTSSASVKVSIYAPPSIRITPDTTICINSQVKLVASGGTSYKWSPSVGLNNSTIANPVASPSINTKYYVEVADAKGCAATDSVYISFLPPAQIGVVSSDIKGCAGEQVQLQAYGGNIYSWSPAIGLSNALVSNPFLQLQTNAQYMVAIKETQCNTAGTFPVSVTVQPAPPVLISKTNDITCNTPSAVLSAGLTGANFLWTPALGLSATDVASPTAAPSVTTVYHVTVQDTNGCTSKGSIELKVINNGDLRLYQLPNAFTPNGDGKNDCFGVGKWGNVEIIYFEIFNRWGQLIFNNKTDGPCWNGNYNGIKQPSGNYVYKIMVQTLCGIVERKGYVILIR